MSKAQVIKRFKPIPIASPKLLIMNQEIPSKKVDFSDQILIKLRF